MFTIFNTQTGEIRPGVLVCNELQLQANTPPGCAAIDGAFEADRYRVEWKDNGDGSTVPVAVERSDVQNDALRVELAARDVRNERNRRLTLTGWIVERSVEAGEAVPEAWRIYRQALRDVPQQAGFPDVVEWPEEPAP